MCQSPSMWYVRRILATAPYLLTSKWIKAPRTCTGQSYGGLFVSNRQPSSCAGWRLKNEEARLTEARTFFSQLFFSFLFSNTTQFQIKCARSKLWKDRNGPTSSCSHGNKITLSYKFVCAYSQSQTSLGSISNAVIIQLSFQILIIQSLQTRGRGVAAAVAAAGCRPPRLGAVRRPASSQG